MRRLWAWIRAVVTEHGEHEPVPIQLERVPSEDGDGEARFAFRLGVRAGIGGQETARIPVYRRMNPAEHPILKEIHSCEVGGQTLEAANVYALKGKVARLLETIAPARTLPLCYFRVPEMDYELPVFEDGDEIVAPVLTGRDLRANDLAGIRRNVCRHLVASGYVRDADEVTVGVVRPRDLRRVPPAAVFRSLDDPAFWVPAVEGMSADGPVVGVLGSATSLGGGERRRSAIPRRAPAPPPAAPDVVSLLRLLQSELATPRVAVEPSGVYATDVGREIWEYAERRAAPRAHRLVAHLSDEEGTRLELEVRETGAGEVVAALVDRSISIFLAGEPGGLAQTVGRYLSGHGFLRFADEVEVEVAGAPRPESLATDTIWTHGNRFGDPPAAEPTDEPKEVHQAWS